MKFQVEGLPPSFNKAFKINYYLRNIYLSGEARNFKTKVKMSMPPMNFPDNCLFMLVIEYHYNWWYKNGKLKKIDSANFDKLLYDAIAEKLGVDDSRFKKRFVEDFHSEVPYTLVDIQVLVSWKK